MLQALVWILYAMLSQLFPLAEGLVVFSLLFTVYFSFAGWFVALSVICVRLWFLHDRVGWLTLIMVVISTPILLLLCAYACRGLGGGIA